MNQKYKATGIILKGSSLKENDRLVTVLTPEYGLIRAVAPGAKKHKSQLRGRTQLFVVNELLLIKGRSLDKIIQADTLYTYPGLSRDLGKLAAAQYLAELSLALAVDEQPQPELYELLNEHLRRIEKSAADELMYPYLAQAVFHLLAIAGLTPQVFDCCVTRKSIQPMPNTSWRAGFSLEGGVIDLEGILALPDRQPELDDEENYNVRLPKIDYRIDGMELAILQQLNRHQLPAELLVTIGDFDAETAWIGIETILRDYIKYHIGKTIRSANLVDSLYAEF
jgi:DNA repair protein RecO (recombination protein O)